MIRLKFTVCVFAVFFGVNLLGAIYKDTNGLSHDVIKENTGFGKNGYRDIKTDNVLTKKGISKPSIYGDMEVTGATISIPTENEYNFNPLNSREETVGVPIKFVKEDGINFTTNSSSATLDFSDKSEFEQKNIDGSKVIFAKLYWAGAISNKWNLSLFSADRFLWERYNSDIKNFNTIKFKTPNGRIHHLTAKEADTKWYGSYTADGMQFMYQANADVTEIVKQTLSKTNRTFTAGDILSSTQTPFVLTGYRDDSWQQNLIAPFYGGWALVIVYDFGTDYYDRLAPKNVNIYDGLTILAPIRIQDTELYRSDSMRLTFSDFYTPTRGEIKSSLSVLTFGAKKEVAGENITIKKDNKWLPVTSQNNQQGEQLNSTITKYGKHLNPNKIYNNQMDLDVYGLSNFIGHSETSTTVELTASIIRKDYSTRQSGRQTYYLGGRKLGERANIGMVGFSTILYVPEVCYMEKIEYKRGDSDFIEISTDEKQKTQLRIGDILKNTLIIKNKGNETAEGVVVTAEFDSENAIKNTYIVPTRISESFDILDSEVNKANLYTLNGKLVDFYVGKGADSGEGGSFDNINRALIRFENVLNGEFKPIDYRVSFKNKSMDYKYESGFISKCESKKYQIETILPEKNEIDVVNKNYVKNKKRSLFTQLSGRAFDVKLMFFDENNAVATTPAIFIKDDVMTVGVVSGGCDADFIESTAREINTKGKTEFDIERVLVNGSYSFLKFKMVYKNQFDETIEKCSSDSFAVRPDKFILQEDGQNINSLIGGKNYDNITIKALKYGGTIDDNFGARIGDIKFTQTNPDGCDIELDELKGLKFNADIKHGEGRLTKETGGVAVAQDQSTNFYYPDIGLATIKAADTKYTSTDSINNDCVINSSASNENINGMIGCDIPLDQSLTFTPKDIRVDKFSFPNDKAAVYLSQTIDNNSPAHTYAKAQFQITARLYNDKPALMYSNGCYAKDVKFNMSFNPGSGTDTNIASTKEKIHYFMDDSKLKQNEDDKFNALAEGFARGVFNGEVKINFAREKNLAINPFQITNDQFEFSDIKDADNVNGTTYIKPQGDEIKSANFYYARLYAPYLEGPKNGFDTNLYYGIYCNNCDSAIFDASNASVLPNTGGWYIDKNAGPDKAVAITFDPKPTSAKARIKESYTLNNGKMPINLSSTVAGYAQINMQDLPEWLIYNQTNKDATYNDFVVKFLDKGGWGGSSLGLKTKDNDGKNMGEGKFIGGSDFEGVSERTNRRIEW
ncbi:hypothetical protein [Campylobacter californiensis]|uniref:hypothetical protein n=1 Tax=Campylobacter californiensis TaxID=1032243 RepID=UPI001475D2C8|nr:hypothetical protein [Campylobacter sp. RM12916]MBE3609927.1 hypothetical protein [Campylobacter sp. RM12916]